MRDRERFREVEKSDLAVWRGMLLGLAAGALMWAVILLLVWKWLF